MTQLGHKRSKCLGLNFLFRSISLNFPDVLCVWLLVYLHLVNIRNTNEKSKTRNNGLKFVMPMSLATSYTNVKSVELQYIHNAMEINFSFQEQMRTSLTWKRQYGLVKIAKLRTKMIINNVRSVIRHMRQKNCLKMLLYQAKECTYSAPCGQMTLLPKIFAMASRQNATSKTVGYTFIRFVERILTYTLKYWNSGGLYVQNAQISKDISSPKIVNPKFTFETNASKVSTDQDPRLMKNISKQSTQHQKQVNPSSFIHQSVGHLNKQKSTMLQTMQTEKINQIETPILTKMQSQKTVTPHYKTHVSQAKKLNSKELRKQIENEAFHEEFMRFSLQNNQNEDSTSKHFTSSQLDFTDKRRFSNHKNFNSVSNFEAWTPGQIQKHIQEITINVMKEENDHLAFVDNLNHFKDQQKALDSNFDLIKQAFLKFSSHSIGIKVRDKMYDVYSRVTSLYQEHIKTYKQQKNEQTKYDEAQDMLNQVGELIRILVRLFIGENKIHIAQMLEKLFKMFVGFFDQMQNIIKAKLKQKLLLINKQELLIDNLKDIEEEIQFIQQNAAIKNIYEEIESNTKKLEKFLGNKREFRKQVSVEVQTDNNNGTRHQQILQAQRDLVSVNAIELISTASMINGNLLLQYWKVRAKSMSEDYFVDQFVNLVANKLNSDIHSDHLIPLNFSQYVVKKYLQALKDPHLTAIELTNLIKTAVQINDSLQDEQLYYHLSKSLSQIYMFLMNILYQRRKTFEKDKDYMLKMAYEIACAAPECQNYILILFGELFSKQNNQFEEGNIEKLMKFMKQYWIEPQLDTGDGYNYQKQTLQKIKHRIVKKFFSFLLTLSESDNTRPLNLFDHFEVFNTIEREKKDIGQYLQKSSFRDFKQPHEQLKKIKIEERAQQILCYLHLHDKNFVKNFHFRFKEKDDYFGAAEIEQIITSVYQDLLCKHDIKVVSQFFRLKYGDSMNIIQFDMEYERAIELISYKHYSPILCLNALAMALFNFSSYQIRTLEKEFIKAKTEYDHILDSKRVKGNFYEPINFQLYTRITYTINPTLAEEDVARTFAHSVGMVHSKEIIQHEGETDDDFQERKDNYDKMIFRKYLEIIIDNGLVMQNLLEINRVEDKKQMFGTKNLKLSKMKGRQR
ncbi:UNKNOWN [Stylonychia lemnae]|uniref:Uncharacterized protein n=1 Tax=Stylonychia lemnae TaxID=5949 RepID=A0A077ZZJ1_STYLE|nr:UNKNOWN [Stylonychia lemnae]|eukprot:CDW75336.1 UNKNOWN [Stylonychia lemnae]